MWVIYTVISYFVLALVLPIAWSLTRVWRRTRGGHAVTCPALGEPAVVGFAPWHAVRMHARGDAELRVIQCSHWPERGDCARECLVQIGSAC